MDSSWLGSSPRQFFEKVDKSCSGFWSLSSAAAMPTRRYEGRIQRYFINTQYYSYFLEGRCKSADDSQSTIYAQIANLVDSSGGII
jgi:hypothetical protein